MDTMVIMVIMDIITGEDVAAMDTATDITAAEHENNIVCLPDNDNYLIGVTEEQEENILEILSSM